MEPDIFGDRLARTIGSQRMNQRMLADRVNVSYKTVSQYINGTAKPSYRVLERIASVLNVSTDYLMGRVDQPYAIQPEGDEEFAKDIKVIRRAYRQITPKERESLLLLARHLLQEPAEKDD